MNTNTGHGHVFPRPDGVKARCGGPGFCGNCNADLARKSSMTQAKERVLWVAFTNTDLTEGRGQQVPHTACETQATAERFAKGIGVMGTDGEVRHVKVLDYDGQLWVPYSLARVVGPSIQDELDEKRRQGRDSALAKAMRAGLTEADIKALRD